MEVWSSQYGVMMEVIAQSGVNPAEIAAIGITNQRETTILWDRATGRPIYNAIVWQCRRTAELVDRLRADGLEEHIRAATGLVPDAYFSATKIKWVLDHVEGPGKSPPGRFCSARWTPGCCGSSLAGPSTPPTSPTPPAPCSLTSMPWTGTTPSSPPWTFPGPCCPRCAPPARFTATPTYRACASPSPAWPATSRPPCSARAASPPATPRTPTAPAASC